MNGHIPVLPAEVLSALALKPGDQVIDGTLGGGGHASAILETTAPNGRLLGIEWDRRTLEETRKLFERYGSRAMLVHGNYRDIGRLARTYAFHSISAILLDIGFSSFQIDDPNRGFSFRFAGPLDMRFDEENETTAAKIVNEWPKEELIRILREYGEENAAGRIAEAIVRARQRKPIVSTDELADLVVRAVRGRRGKIHPATKTFQALRIAVNDELGNLATVLPEAVKLLKPGGRLAIISFHSLEDRIVKDFIRGSKDLKPVTKRPIVAGEEEIETNSRARSAKLRVAEKLP
jgi:16S rRNA (cytosine1402-N4)-methyltransferase